MVGMFAIRRLIESEKTSSRLPLKTLPVLVCSLTGREPNPMDSWRPWHYYDLASRQRSELPVSKLVHEFIHSFVLTMAGEDGEGVSGVLVGSERTKRRHIYLVSMLDLVALFRYVASEEIVAFRGSSSADSYHAERVSNHDLDEGADPGWTVEDMTREIHEALIANLGDPPCPRCLTPMEITGDTGQEHWTCPACGTAKLA